MHGAVAASMSAGEVRRVDGSLGPCLVHKKFCKIFQILRHIKSLDACIKY